MGQTISIVLNGCDEEVALGATIQDLLVMLHEQDQHLIVEHNDIFVPPVQYATRAVAAGDVVEFINPNLGG